MSPAMNRVGRGIYLIVIAALLWSSGGVGIKSLPAAQSPTKIAMYRSLFAAIALLTILRPKRPKLNAPFFISIISYAACLISFVTATKWTTAANAIFLQYSGVVWVMLFSPLVLKEKMLRRDLAAIAIALGGMGLFFVGQLDLHALRGNAVALLSGCFFALLVLSLRLQRGESDEAAVTWGNVLLTLVLLPWVAQHDGLAVDGRSAIVLIALGLFQIALPYFLFVRGLRTVSATQGSLTSMIEPIANPIWVFLVLGERPTSWAILGGAIVLGAISWRTLTHPSEQPVIVD